MTIFLYLGMIFLIVRFSVTVFNFISSPKLPRSLRKFDDKVSILIPARNESSRILSLLNSIEAQDYSNYEVLILDDLSDDNTYEVVSEFCRSHPQFKIIKGQELPSGWLGKNYACHQLAEQASGSYFLYLDADERIERGLINSLIFRIKVEQLALISLFTNQEFKTFGERCTVPLMHFVLLNLLPLRLVKLSSYTAFSAASGQCMFFDAHIYRQQLWHNRVRAKVVEDIEIVKEMKQSGQKVESLLANRMVYCRMYESFSEALNGFSKNFLAGFDYKIFSLLLYLLFVMGLPLVVFSTFNLQVFLLPLSLIVLSRVMISMLSQQNVLMNVLLHPLQMLCMILIACLSIYKYFTKSGVWKGRSIRTTS